MVKKTVEVYWLYPLIFTALTDFQLVLSGLLCVVFGRSDKNLLDSELKNGYIVEILGASRRFS